MLCQPKTNTQWNLESSEVKLSPEERQRLRAAMAVAVAVLRKLRSLKMYRDSHKRLYRRRGHLIRAKAKAFATSPRGREYYREYSSRRLKTPRYHFLNWIRGDINRSLRRQSARKSARKEELIGCTFNELRAHLASQFGTEFTWGNRSSVWDVDHIVPTSVFNLQDSEEQRVCFNWKNMRPMERMANKSKSAKITLPLASWIPSHIAARVVERAGGRVVV